MSGSVWASVYSLFTDPGGFWAQLVQALPQMATWYCVYVMLYGAGYQVMKLLHLKSVCRFLFHQARARTPRDYMKAISPVYIDWGTFQPYTVLFFFVGILYAHLQPLLLPMCLLYFLVGMLVMRYMCIYAWYFRQETAGAIWPVVFRRMAACVMAYQALTTAVFAGERNRWFVAPMLVLLLFSWFYFWVRCPALRQLAIAPPLQLIREADRRRAGGSVPQVVLPGDQIPDEISDQIPDQISDDEQALMPGRPRTALVRPLAALVESVSRALAWLHGDPAACLWPHLDDYAFPERVDQLTPAGRSHADPRMAKDQPGSLLDILRSIITGVPRACRAIGHEFFMNFSVPRAYLDSSVASYPQTQNIESAFETRHRREFPKPPRSRGDAGENGLRDEDEKYADEDAASLFPPPAQSPASPLAPRMQYQAASSELPFGTQLNRRRTDFAQPNMSYLPGILDSTPFTYEHPALHGHLPSLWLPVQRLKRRHELKRSAHDRLRSALHALESAFEENFIGQRAADRLGATGRHVRRRVRDKLTPLSTRTSLDSSSRVRAPSDDIASVDAANAPSSFVADESVLRQVDDLLVRSRCDQLGIDPAVVAQWDPLGLHRAQTSVMLTDDPALISVDNEDPMSASDSDFDDSEESARLSLRTAEAGQR
ncbi:hypothetical protein H4S01_001246 [Coemansia sp. RSA 2610]|nr:hypothetical protein H4S01_001246 [Coemansia sp. RSA 2610]